VPAVPAVRADRPPATTLRRRPEKFLDSGRDRADASSNRGAPAVGVRLWEEPVALQGSIDTFALADVLRLLASTGKTGRLALEGDRGQGEVVVLDGSVASVAMVGVERPQVSFDEELFELLRFESGDFEFTAVEDLAVDGEESWEVEHLLGQAAGLLDEWRRIESVVPSSDAWVRLRPELGDDEVTIGASGWRTVAAVGSGTTVSGLAAVMGTTDLGIGRELHALVELGVLEVSSDLPLDAALVPVGTTVVVETVVDDAGSDDPRFDEPVFDEAELDDVEVAAAAANWVEADGVTTEIVAEVSSPDWGGVDDDPFGPDDDEAADFARQLASLSPKAAKAVAAAAMAESPEERDRVLAEVAGEEAIDQELLLRFLGAEQD
jgi:hypothetical protein